MQVGDNVDVGRGVFTGTISRIRMDDRQEPIYTVTGDAGVYVARACEMRKQNTTNQG